MLSKWEGTTCSWAGVGRCMGFVSSNGFFGAVGLTGYRVHDRV